MISYKKVFFTLIFNEGDFYLQIPATITSEIQLRDRLFFAFDNINDFYFYFYQKSK